MLVTLNTYGLNFIENNMSNFNNIWAYRTILFERKLKISCQIVSIPFLWDSIYYIIFSSDFDICHIFHIRVLHLSVILLNNSISAAKTWNIRWKRLSCQLVNYELNPLREGSVIFDAYCTRSNLLQGDVGMIKNFVSFIITGNWYFMW